MMTVTAATAAENAHATIAREVEVTTTAVTDTGVRLETEDATIEATIVEDAPTVQGIPGAPTGALNDALDTRQGKERLRPDNWTIGHFALNV